MHLAGDELFRADQWLEGIGNADPEKLSREEAATILEIMGLGFSFPFNNLTYEADGNFAPAARAEEFFEERIEALLEPERFQAIAGGSQPTAQEIQTFLDEENKMRMEDEMPFHFYVWKIRFSKGDRYFRSLHGDGGLMDHFFGPFLSLEEAMPKGLIQQ